MSLLWTLCGLLLLSACSINRRTVEPDAQVERAQTEVAENQLLDVWIALFSTGELPEDEDDSAGLSVEIREAVAGSGSTDIVALLGKGAENYQIVGSDRLAFSDRNEAEGALRAWKKR